MASKLEFIRAAERAGANISALCREHGISRQSGHKWLKRYRELGPSGLEEQSRRPKSSPGRTAQEVVDAVLARRKKYRKWGPKTLALVLRKELGDETPSPATIARILKSAGKIKERRAAVRVWHVEERPRVEVSAPNDLWTIDFKGWWRAKNGERCEPLTVRDAMCRVVLAVTLVVNTNGPAVRRVLEKLFVRHGVPVAMLMDNGSPWVSTRSRAGLTELSAWLVSLGIRLYRSRPGAPQDNGGHERMHRDLDELRLEPARSRRAQQLRCEQWRVDFNHLRPHQALGGRTPAEVYGRPPKRPMLARVPVYPGCITRRVLASGEITLNGDRVSLGRGLRGRLVGLQHESGLRWRAWYFDVDLGTVEIAGHDLFQVDLARAVTRAVNPNEGTEPVTPVSA